AAEHTRRSVYVLVRRTFIYPLLSAFDPPEVMTSCPRRQQTIVPAQALALLNSPLAAEQSRAYARRLLQECGDPQAALPRACLPPFGRRPPAKEPERAVQFLHQRAAAADRETALAGLCLALFNASEFVYLD